MATKATDDGNIWISSSVMSPARRPLNRRRENANAAKAASTTVKKPSPGRSPCELRNHVQNGWSLRSVSKFCQSDLVRDQLRLGEAALGSRRDHHPVDGEQGEHQHDEGDDVTPAGVAEALHKARCVPLGPWNPRPRRPAPGPAPPLGLGDGDDPLLAARRLRSISAPPRRTS